MFRSYQNSLLYHYTQHNTLTRTNTSPQNVRIPYMFVWYFVHGWCPFVWSDVQAVRLWSQSVAWLVQAEAALNHLYINENFMVKRNLYSQTQYLTTLAVHKLQPIQFWLWALHFLTTYNESVTRAILC